MNHGSKFVRIADAVSGFNEQSMGDEREALVITRAYTFALVVGTALLMCVGAALTLFGYWGFALGAIIFAGLQSYLAVGYASVQGVSVFGLNDKSSGARKRATYIFGALVLIVLIAGRAYHLITGHPLIGTHAVTEPAHVVSSTSEAVGLIVGALCGIGAVFVTAAILKRRAARRSTVDED